MILPTYFDLKKGTDFDIINTKRESKIQINIGKVIVFKDSDDRSGSAQHRSEILYCVE